MKPLLLAEGSFCRFYKGRSRDFQAMSQYYRDIGPLLLTVLGELRRGAGADRGSFQFSPPKKPFQAV